ncbi:hypothetical protein BDR04DRAFT_1096413 [Suillus decipiens]|nr:hypothetical protein BDR04DRAFT_1096413 [Suillus decipiens]
MTYLPHKSSLAYCSGNCCNFDTTSLPQLNLHLREENIWLSLDTCLEEICIESTMQDQPAQTGVLTTSPVSHAFLGP